MFSSRPASTSAPARPRLLPWVEKYRPAYVDDIAHQDEIILTLKGAIKSGNLPHLLFYGPPGTGKTTTILAVAREIFGVELMKSRVLELNASDERGISVIREKVKKFAQSIVSNGGSSCPPFKIIVLDEADSMTAEAQAALRRTMENYSKMTRFCLICNYVSRIIGPLASRCAKFRFQNLEVAPMQKRLEFIIEKEQITVDQQVLRTILEISDGDMRKAITLLQSAHQLYNDGVTSESIRDVAGVIPKTMMKEFWEAVRSKRFENVQEQMEQLSLMGYAALTILKQIQEDVYNSKELSGLQKSKINIKIAEADKHLADGADEGLQILDVGCFILDTVCASAVPA